jgi:hypothetical protein
VTLACPVSGASGASLAGPGRVADQPGGLSRGRGQPAGPAEPRSEKPPGSTGSLPRRARTRPGPTWPAGSLTTLAVYLGNLGRPEDALTAIREAAGIYRELAAKWPDAYSRSWNSRSELAPGSRRAETSATIQQTLSSDNGPLSGLPPTLGRSNALDDKDVQNRLRGCARHPRAMAW